MSRDEASLLDINQAGQQVLLFAEGFNQSELQKDKMRMSAILYQILILGEATKRLSKEFKLANQQISWSKIAGMRDIVAHQYDGIEFKSLWNVIQYSIPELLEKIAPLLPIEPPI